MQDVNGRKKVVIIYYFHIRIFFFYSFQKPLRMQVLVSYPDLELPNVSLTVEDKTTVQDVLREVSKEWNIDEEEIELSLAGELLPNSDRLVSLGITSETEFIVFRAGYRLFGLSHFICDEKREKMLKHYEFIKREYLFVDTSTLCRDGYLYFNSCLLPQEIKAISFRNCTPNCVTTIDDDFLRDCSELTNVDLSELTGVGTIGDGFLAKCKLIKKLELSSFSDITTVGNGFLFNNSSITSLDLSAFSSLSKIGDSFLINCTSLTTLNMSGLCNVTSIGNLFIGNSSLASIDLSDWCAVTSIGHEFLLCNPLLTSLDLSAFNNLKSIGDGFLINCTSLTTLNLSSLCNVTSVGSGLLITSISLTSLQLPKENRLLFLEKAEDMNFLISCLTPLSNQHLLTPDE